jgi:glutamate 5-kinase
VSTPTRDAVTGARRIVVKVGSSSLTTAAGGIDPDRIRVLVDTLAQARARGTEIVLVSSGAIAAGLAPLALTRRPNDLARQQAAASVGQGILVHRYTDEFARHGQVTGQVLLTLDDVTRRGHYRNAQRTFVTLLELGVVPIVNENDTVATTEIRFGDNDRLAALVAHLVQADLLVLLSDVDGLYDGPPTAPGAQLIAEVRSEADLADVVVGKSGAAGVGTGGMQTKVEAARIACGAGVAVVLTSADQARSALEGDVVGTYFHPTGARRSTRMLWLAHAVEGKGRIVIDDGAVRALTERQASLLPAGITAVEGAFIAGDPVDLVSREGRVVARGLVNFDSTELPSLMGRSTHELAAALGAHYEREVVHRDDLTLLENS